MSVTVISAVGLRDVVNSAVGLPGLGCGLIAQGSENTLKEESFQLISATKPALLMDGERLWEGIVGSETPGKAAPPQKA